MVWDRIKEWSGYDGGGAGSFSWSGKGSSPNSGYPVYAPKGYPKTSMKPANERGSKSYSSGKWQGGYDPGDGQPPNKTKTPQPTTDWGGSSSGGGGGGGGGYRASTYSAPSIGRTVIDQSMLQSDAHLKRALSDLERARQKALTEKAGLDAQFEQRMDSLREQFNFSETAEEKRMLSRALADIEAQRDAGYQAIEQGYADAVAQANERGASSEQATAEETAAVAGLYSDAQTAVREGAAATNAAYDAEGGGALGAGADGGSAGAEDFARMLAAEGASEQALTQRLGNITAEGAGWMADTLAGQGQAAQGDLNRMALATRNRADMEHQRRVQERIQQERMMFNQMYGQTRNMYDERGFQLSDQDRQILADKGQLRFEGGEAKVQRQLEAAMQQAQLDAQRAQANAQMRAQAASANASARNAAARSAAAARASSSGSKYTVPEMLASLQQAPTSAYRNQLGSYLVQNHGLPESAARSMGVR